LVVFTATTLLMAKSKAQRKAKKAKGKTAQRVQVNRRQGPTLPRAALSECVAEYGRLLVNPFVKEHKACVPMPPAIPSRKVSVYQKGTFATQANSFGFMSMNPYAGILNASVDVGTYNTPANQPFVWGSTGTGVGNFVLTPGAANTFWLESNTDYTTNSVSALDAIDQDVRLVAAGLKIRFNGTALNAGGVICLAEDPAHVGFSNASNAGATRWTFSAMSDLDEGSNDQVSFGREYCVTYRPIYPDEFGYATAALMKGSNIQGAPDDPDILQSANWYDILACTIVSALPSQQFYFEAYAHYELIGSAVRGRTPSHIDTVGTSKFQEVVGDLAVRKPFVSFGSEDREARASGLLDNVGQLLIDGAAKLGRLALTAGGTAIGTAFGGPAGGAFGGMLASGLSSAASAVANGFSAPNRAQYSSSIRRIGYGEPFVEEVM